MSVRKNMPGALVLAAVIRLFHSAATADEIAGLKAISTAKPGSTVFLPAGTFDAGELLVPSQVGLKGAGYDKTILNGSVRIKDARAVTISDLTVQGASAAAVSVENSAGVTIERVRALRSSVGVRLNGARETRVQNAVAADNRVGFVLRGAEKSAIVNCTAANNSEIAISLAGNHRCAVFNNLFVGSQTGVFCAADNAELALDHNLYVALFVGSTTGEPARESLASWQSRSGHDRRSVELKVEFADAKAGDFRPITPLPWAPARATASDWGVRELAGAQAPAKDLDDKPRTGEVDLGAHEISLPAPRSNGKFTVQSGEGVTSAGLYATDGKKVAALFDNLPLRKGEYEFWTPPGVVAGKYELRVVESDLRLRCITALGSIGADNTLENSNAIDPTLAAFDPHDNLLLFQGGAEDHTIARSFAPGLQRARWRLAGDGGAVGAAVDADGSLFFLRRDGMIFKVKADTGEGLPIDGASFCKPLKGVFSDKLAGLTAWDGKLLVADPEKNKILVAAAGDLNFKSGLDLPSPCWPAADLKNQLLWAISGDKLVALDATGAKKHEAAPIARPVALAVNNGRLAVYSAETKRVHVFDCADPVRLKPITVMGREWKSGDTGLGPIQLDRLSGDGVVAINSIGDVVALDQGAPKLFKADGAFVRAPMPMWGQFVACGWWTGADGNPQLHVTGMRQTQTIVLDFERSSWKPGLRFALPACAGRPEGVGGTLAAFFTEGGKNFAAYTEDKSPFRHWVARIEPDGSSKLAADLSARESAPGLRFLSDGRLLAGNVVLPQSVAAGGNLVYDWSKYSAEKSKPLPTGGQGNFNGGFLADGSWVNGSGKSRGFGGGFTALQATDADGATRWEFPIDYHCTIGAFRSARVLPGVALAMATEELDTVFTTHDGLGLGVVGPAADFRWSGYWHDQDWSLRAFVGPDNKRYLLLGDYIRHTAHWLELTGVDEVKRNTVALAVDAASAQPLTSAKIEPVHNPTPPRPTVTFRKLAAPLKMDGDLQKWRALGIAPQIMVVPPGIAPTDCSALIRCAWEGDNLYFQVIKFDNVVTMHQALNLFYKQDSIELALVGGFMGGYKFGIARTTDQGDVIYREQFLMKKELLLDPSKAARVIKVLANAAGIEERKLIESSLGVDLSKAQAIITEFMIPMSYAWDGKAPVEMKSGASFWMGWFIDDNDTPGLDEQKAYPWPVTFAAFGQPDQGALAALE